MVNFGTSPAFPAANALSLVEQARAAAKPLGNSELLPETSGLQNNLPNLPSQQYSLAN